MADKPDPFWQLLWSSAMALAEKASSQAGTYMVTSALATVTVVGRVYSPD